MNKDYITPAETDAVWADVIVIAAPHGFGASSPEIAGFLSLLRSLASGGSLSKKTGGAFVSTSLTGDDDTGVASISPMTASFVAAPRPRRSGLPAVTNQNRDDDNPKFSPP